MLHLRLWKYFVCQLNSQTNVYVEVTDNLWRVCCHVLYNDRQMNSSEENDRKSEIYYDASAVTLLPIYRRQVDLDLSDLTRQGHPGAVLGCAGAQTPDMS